MGTPRGLDDPLTERQAQVLRFIAEHILQWQRPPTRKEISRHFGWSAANAAEDHIKALAAKGHIAMDDSGEGGQGARYPRVLRWPADLLPVLRFSRPITFIPLPA